MVKSGKNTDKKINTDQLQKLLVVLLVVMVAFGMAALHHGEPSEAVGWSSS